MSRKENPEQRCTHCLMHRSLCICSVIPRLHNRTKVVLYIPARELRKPTNTGRLAAACLVNSQVHVRGEGPDQPVEVADAARGHTLLLFPDADAAPLGSFPLSDGPVTLVVPDGSWRQAAKVRSRVPGLAKARCVTLPSGPPSTYRLRQEPRAQGLATMEAIARALGVLEGPHIQAALELVFRVFVDRTLWLRGDMPDAMVAGGLPPGATREPGRLPVMAEADGD